MAADEGSATADEGPADADEVSASGMGGRFFGLSFGFFAVESPPELELESDEESFLISSTK